MTISVVIATYGDREWEELACERALPSVLHQDVDLNNVVVWHYPEGTRASSLNDGAARAKGDWLCFLDADDELAPGFIGAMRQAVERHPDGGVLLTPAVQQIRKGRPGRPFFFPEVDLKGGNWLIIGTLIERSLFMEIGGFHEHPHGLEDFNLWARAVRAGARILKVPDAVYVAHVNPQSKHHKLQRNREEYIKAYHAAVEDAWG